MKLEEIKKRYNITEDSLEEIKTELKKKLKESHPDNNSSSDIDYFIELKEDLDYVESLVKKPESDEALVPVNEVTQIIKEILQVQHSKDIAQKEKLEIELSENVEHQISAIKRWGRIPKYSSASILAVITFLWMFPNQILAHPLMQMFFKYREIEFTMWITGLWLLVLTVTCFLWLVTIQKERIEKEIVERVKLESFQERIFTSFLEEVYPEGRFTKLKFMEYLAHSINIASDVKVRFIRRFHLREGVIQNMADIILLRAKEYEVIKKVKSHSLVECYEIVQDE